MNFVAPNFIPALPEIFVLAMACTILILDLFIKDKNRDITYLLSLATLIGAAILTISLGGEGRQLTFNDMFVVDPMGNVLKVFIYLITAVVLVYSRHYLQLREMYRGEYFVLSLFAVLGMMVMVSAHSMLTIYIGLELLSLSLYAMVAFQRDSLHATEAALKYFVLGALAAGMLLYGMSLVYGMTGSLDLAEIGAYVAMNSDNVVLLVGVAFIVVGIAFKLGAVPFHMWVPDVYHGAPTSVTLFIATAPKIAAFAMVMRLLVEGLGDLHDQWQNMLIVLAVASIAVGNVIAIAQTNIKRMLAYSTISHVGFILLGILAGTESGYSSAMFYVVVYALMGLGGFGMIILLSRSGFEADKLDDFKGLNERSPWMAFMMLILLFSMAGVPPAVGFYAKLAVLQSVVDVGLVWLAVYAVVFSVVGAFYYLRVVKVMYFDKPEDTSPIQAGFDMRVVLSANSLGILALGIFPAVLMQWCIAVL
ncbi:MAG TPA: NADH-quinone oxidoreductase subunit NuoN [Candidatus Tenderia sp.]|nr:NADH-quinone oxidoreductase subunit NuoN [Candidatus Tenderia sp.]